MKEGDFVRLKDVGRKSEREETWAQSVFRRSHAPLKSPQEEEEEEEREAEMPQREVFIEMDVPEKSLELSQHIAEERDLELPGQVPESVHGEQSLPPSPFARSVSEELVVDLNSSGLSSVSSGGQGCDIQDAQGEADGRADEEEGTRLTASLRQLWHGLSIREIHVLSERALCDLAKRSPSADPSNTRGRGAPSDPPAVRTQAYALPAADRESNEPPKKSQTKEGAWDSDLESLPECAEDEEEVRALGVVGSPLFSEERIKKALSSSSSSSKRGIEVSKLLDGLDSVSAVPHTLFLSLFYAVYICRLRGAMGAGVRERGGKTNEIRDPAQSLCKPAVALLLDKSPAADASSVLTSRLKESGERGEERMKGIEGVDESREMGRKREGGGGRVGAEHAQTSGEVRKEVDAKSQEVGGEAAAFNFDQRERETSTEEQEGRSVHEEKINPEKGELPGEEGAEKSNAQNEAKGEKSREKDADMDGKETGGEEVKTKLGGEEEMQQKAGEPPTKTLHKAEEKNGGPASSAEAGRAHRKAAKEEEEAGNRGAQEEDDEEEDEEADRGPATDPKAQAALVGLALGISAAGRGRGRRPKQPHRKSGVKGQTPEN